MSKIRGTTVECFLHYVATLPPRGSKEARRARQPIADFTGASLDSVDRWVLSGDPKLKGLPLLKLNFFLELMGYEVKTLRWLSNHVYKVAKILAFDVSHIKNISSRLGFTNTDSVFRVVLGKGDVNPDKIPSIDALWEDFGYEAEQKRKEWARKLHPSSEGRSSEKQAVPLATSEKERTLFTLAYAILLTVDFAEEVASDRFSAEDRKRLREMTEGDKVFRISNALNKLCGEKARDLILEKEGKRLKT